MSRKRSRAQFEHDLDHHREVKDISVKAKAFGSKNGLSDHLADDNNQRYSRLSIENIEVHSSEDDVEGYHQVHPLLIPHITENILKKTFGSVVDKAISDVSTCRLVCSRWNEVATKIFRKEADDLVFGEDNKSDSKKMRTFLQDMENSTNIPFQKYRFDPGFFVQKNDDLLKQFLYNIKLVELRLWFDNESTLRFSKRCYPDLKLDSLQYLFFGCVNYRGKASTERIELTYMLDAMLTATTNLKRFSFSFPPKDIRSQQIIIKKFGDLIGEKVPKTVKNLKLEMKVTDAQLEALTNIGLSLDTFHCDLRGSKLNRSALYKLFTSQKNTLLELRLLDSENKYNYELQFPRFEKLTVLELQGAKTSPFSFKDKFPVLERLVLFGWENVETLKPFLSSPPCSCLKRLELPYKISDANLVYLASKSFPNLSRLEITPTLEGMDALGNVFKFMTSLTELDITFPFIIDEELFVDSVFTGIPKEDCIRILRNGEIESTDLQTVQKNPSITNLTKLKRLTIQDHSNEIRLTDVTAFFALLKLDNLQDLEIGHFQMSRTIFQMLTEKVNLTHSYESSDSDFDLSDDENA